MIIEEACCSSCGASADQDQTDLAIACTLSSSSLEERVASIRNLASRHLLSSRREMRTLHLTYAAAALPEVEDLVAEESDCCTSFDFALHAGETVELTITAPQSAAAAADELFAHFAAELARPAP